LPSVPTRRSSALLTRWCDATVEGNSMAQRMASLIDPNTKKLLEGAIEKVDDHTVKLKLQAPDVTIVAGVSDYPALLVHPSFDETRSEERRVGKEARSRWQPESETTRWRNTRVE